ncbi:Aste57867_18295 [Aphanomyces stellatus]|uniref:Aste57867_18295 protein n=1 Tax=Aphanomyces stellatus TaxID=120398 RepID=A0A485L9Z8_9STRA|nr:hypothetical protein As57867_018233 [Aphanomyces stellatus]VFT95032.1 Aste57867_18295 [Aphanomyces stellatus]
MARKRAVKRPRAGSVDATRVVVRPSGREYRILDGLPDEITPMMWEAIEAYEAERLGLMSPPATQVLIESQSAMLYQDICPESPSSDDSVPPQAPEACRFDEQDEFCPASPSTSSAPPSAQKAPWTPAMKLDPSSQDEDMLHATEMEEGSTSVKWKSPSLPPPINHEVDVAMHVQASPRREDDTPAAATCSDQTDEAAVPMSAALPIDPDPSHVINPMNSLATQDAVHLTMCQDSPVAHSTKSSRTAAPPSPHQNTTSAFPCSPPPSSMPIEVTPPPSSPEHMDALHLLVNLSAQCPSLGAWLRHEGDVDPPPPHETYESDNSNDGQDETYAMTGDTMVLDEDTQRLRRLSTEVTQSLSAATTHVSSTMPPWPPHLTRRCHLVQPIPSHPSMQPLHPPSCILLWLQQTWRLHDNYAFEAAEWLGAHTHLPVVAFAVFPDALFHPAVPASTNMHGLRASVAAMRRQLQARAISLHGVLASQMTATVADTLLSFCPHAIVTDDLVHESPLPTTVSLYAMESACAVPWRRIIDQVDSRVAFRAAWGTMWDEQTTENDTTNDDTMRPPPPEATVVVDASNFKVHSLPWPNLDRPSSSLSLPAMDLSERAAIAYVESLVAVGTTRPALQEELHGRGMTACLPFLRHGSLSPVYLLRRLASKKVLYSRALEQCILPMEFAVHVLRQSELRGSSRSLKRYHPWLPTQPNSTDVTTYPSPHEIEASRSSDRVWNDMQTHFRLTGYLHPLFTTYWGRRLVSWSPSSHAGLGLIEALIMRYSIGASPAVVVASLLGLSRDGLDFAMPSTNAKDDEDHKTPRHPLLVQLQAALAALDSP